MATSSTMAGGEDEDMEEVDSDRDGSILEDISDDEHDEPDVLSGLTGASNASNILRTLEAHLDRRRGLMPVARQMMFGPGGSRQSKGLHKRKDWNEHAAQTVRNNTFHRRYHMTYSTFNKLVDLLDIQVDAKQSMRSTGGNSPITPQHIVGGGLRYLLGGSKRIDLADILGTSDSSIDRMVDLFLDAVLECEALQIKLPKGEELRTTMNGFWNISTAGDLFKGCVGCIDGWLVMIVKQGRVRWKM